MKKHIKFFLLCLIMQVIFYTGIFAQYQAKSLSMNVGTTSIIGSCFEKIDGKLIVFTVVTGEPAEILGYDTQTGKLEYNAPIFNLKESWRITVSSTGVLYIAGTDGHLYSYKPKINKVFDLGKPFNEYTVIFDIVSGENGVIYGGTSPNCKLFSYAPQDGFHEIGTGPIVVGENYLRSLAFDKKSNKLLLGIGMHAHLIEFDLISHKKKDLAVSQLKNMTFVYTLNLLSNEQLLFARVTSASSKSKIICVNLIDDFVHELGDLDVNSIVHKNGFFWGLYNHQVAKSENYSFANSRIVASKLQGSILAAYSDAADNFIYMLADHGYLITIDTKNNSVTGKQLKLEQQPVKIAKMAIAPNGKIWSSGLVAGGTSLFDPLTNKNIILGNLGQIEGVGFLKNFVFIGTYPHCNIYRYDQTKDWSLKEGNPKLMINVKGQNRPVTSCSIENKDLVFFGTLPEYGKLGGSLIAIDNAHDRVSVFKDIVPNQSIISLVQVNGMIYGGTSVYGDIGTSPVARSAEIFVWDPRTQRKVFDFNPFPNAKNVFGLTVDNSGNIWGVADATIFVFDPKTKIVNRSKKIMDIVSYNEANVSGEIVISRSGNVFLNLFGNLYSVNQRELSFHKIMTGVNNLSYDKKDVLYFSKGSEIMTYRIY